MDKSETTMDPTLYDHDLAVSIAGGNVNVAAELLSLLLRELPSHDVALRKAFDAGNMEELRRASHKLHGSASYCGTRALVASARELESAIPAVEFERVTAAYENLLLEIRRLLDAYMGRIEASESSRM